MCTPLYIYIYFLCNLHYMMYCLCLLCDTCLSQSIRQFLLSIINRSRRVRTNTHVYYIVALVLYLNRTAAAECYDGAGKIEPVQGGGTQNYTEATSTQIRTVSFELNVHVVAQPCMHKLCILHPGGRCRQWLNETWPIKTKS